MEKKRNFDEDEYLDWYFSMASGRWVRYIPRKTKPLKKVYTPEMMIRDLKSAFCGGRYSSWVNAPGA